MCHGDLFVAHYRLENQWYIIINRAAAKQQKSPLKQKMREHQMVKMYINTTLNVQS